MLLVALQILLGGWTSTNYAALAGTRAYARDWMNRVLPQFEATQHLIGNVAITWAADHGIKDLDPVPKPFDGNAASARLNYLLRAG